MGAIWKLIASVTIGAVAAFGVTDNTADRARALDSAARASSSPTLVGAFSADWNWFDRAVGPAQIYRVFDTGGFHFDTWQETAAYRRHPNATAFDYSFDVLPQRLANPDDPINGRIRRFLATTPKNLIITDYHEPDDEFGLFTPAQYRAGILALSDMVRAQNSIDGGTRMTSVILMDITFTDAWSTKAIDWWPTDARDGGHVDLIEGDMYEWPHATNTPGVPPGYTDGRKWRSARALLSPLHTFAQEHNTPWAIAELGVLEDVHNPSRRADELAQAVEYARDNGALHICYFDNKGPRADWRLRWSSPPGTQSDDSPAALMWKSLMDTPDGGAGPGPATQQWVGNQGFDGGSKSGWTRHYSWATRLSTRQQADNWLLEIKNADAREQDVGACNANPYWVTSTTAGATYRATAQIMSQNTGSAGYLFVREVRPDGAQVAFVRSTSVTLSNTTALVSLPTVSLTAQRTGDSLRMCVVAQGLPADGEFFVDNLSLTSAG